MSHFQVPIEDTRGTGRGGDQISCEERMESQGYSSIDCLLITVTSLSNRNSLIKTIRFRPAPSLSSHSPQRPPENRLRAHILLRNQGWVVLWIWALLHRNELYPLLLLQKRLQKLKLSDKYLFGKMISNVRRYVSRCAHRLRQFWMVNCCSFCCF